MSPENKSVLEQKPPQEHAAAYQGIDSITEQLRMLHLRGKIPEQKNLILTLRAAKIMVGELLRNGGKLDNYGRIINEDNPAPPSGARTFIPERFGSIMAYFELNGEINIRALVERRGHLPVQKRMDGVVKGITRFVQNIYQDNGLSLERALIKPETATLQILADIALEKGRGRIPPKSKKSL